MCLQQTSYSVSHWVTALVHSSARAYMSSWIEVSVLRQGPASDLLVGGAALQGLTPLPHTILTPARRTFAAESHRRALGVTLVKPASPAGDCRCVVLSVPGTSSDVCPGSTSVQPRIIERGSGPSCPPSPGGP